MSAESDPARADPRELDPDLQGEFDGSERPVGRWESIHPGGPPRRTVECVDGLVHGTDVIRDEDGVVVHEWTWDRGLPHGQAIDRFHDGRPESEGTFRHGRRHGLFRTWGEDGTLLTSATYRDDVPDGPCASWYPDGTPHEEGAWAEGREHGRWRVRYPDGSLASETSMAHGTPHGRVRDLGPDGAVLLDQEFIHGVPANRGFAWARGLGRGRPTWRFLAGLAVATGLLLWLDSAIVLGLVALGLVIVVHEVGHWLAAGVVGIPIQVFQVGFGPSLASFFFRGTLVQIRLVPLFGYVRPHVQRASEFRRTRGILAGEDEDALPPVVPEEEPASTVSHVTRPARIVFYSGGIALNLLLATVLVWAIRHPGDPVAAVELTGRMCGRVLASMPEMLGRLLHLGTYTEYTPGLLAGVKDASKEGMGFGELFVILNVVLAAFNLLPLPLLDGFWCLRTAIETVIRRDLPGWVLSPLHLVGVLLIGALCVTGVYFLGRDILVMIFG